MSTFQFDEQAAPRVEATYLTPDVVAQRREVLQALGRAGFRLPRREVIPLFNPEYDANTYSARMFGLIATFASGRQGVTKEEAEAWAEDLRKLGEAGSYFFSLNRYLFLAVKSDTRHTG